MEGILKGWRKGERGGRYRRSSRRGMRGGEGQLKYWILIGGSWEEEGGGERGRRGRRLAVGKENWTW